MCEQREPRYCAHLFSLAESAYSAAVAFKLMREREQTKMSTQEEEAARKRKRIKEKEEAIQAEIQKHRLQEKKNRAESLQKKVCTCMWVCMCVHVGVYVCVHKCCTWV